MPQCGDNGPGVRSSRAVVPFYASILAWTVRVERSLTAAMLFSADGAPSPATNRGANQTLFIRRIALRTPRGYFDKSSFGPTVPDPSFFDRIAATFFNPPQAWWLVEDKDNTLSLTAAAPGSDIDIEVPGRYDASGTVTEDEGGSDDISP